VEVSVRVVEVSVRVVGISVRVVEISVRFERGMCVRYKGSQGQTKRTVELQEEEEEEEVFELWRLVFCDLN
jgi:hypothetical protein